MLGFRTAKGEYPQYGYAHTEGLFKELIAMDLSETWEPYKFVVNKSHKCKYTFIFHLFYSRKRETNKHYGRFTNLCLFWNNMVQSVQIPTHGSKFPICYRIKTISSHDLARQGARTSIVIVLCYRCSTDSNPTSRIDPVCAKFFRRNRNIYFHFMSFFHIDMVEVDEIIPQVRQELTYSCQCHGINKHIYRIFTRLNGINTVTLQYIPRNMHTVFALLCFVVVIHWLIIQYPSGLLHWHCGNITIVPVPAKQPWWIWINTSCEFIMNDCITTTKQSTTKPCAYFLGYTVR